MICAITEMHPPKWHDVSFYYMVISLYFYYGNILFLFEPLQTSSSQQSMNTYFNKQITSDTVFLVATTLCVELLFRILACIYSWTRRISDSFVTLVFCLILSVIIASQLPKIENFFVKLLVLLHLSVAGAVPLAYLLATYQCLTGHWTFHYVIYLPAILKVTSIVLVITYICFVIVCWLYFATHSVQVCIHSIIIFYQFPFPFLYIIIISYYILK